MRKRISCRVIESVPLNHSEKGLIHAYESCTTDTQNGGFAGVIHSAHPAITRLYLDNGPTPGILDILA